MRKVPGWCSTVAIEIDKDSQPRLISAVGLDSSFVLIVQSETCARFCLFAYAVIALSF